MKAPKSVVKIRAFQKQMAAQVQNCCIYVGNVPASASPEDLYAFFSTFGEIKSIDLPKQPLSKRPRGFAFIEFDEHEDAMAAIDNYDGTEFKGRNLKVRKSKQSQLKQNYHKAVWDNESWLQQNNVREAAQADRLQQMAKDDIYAS